MLRWVKTKQTKNTILVPNLLSLLNGFIYRIIYQHEDQTTDHLTVGILEKFHGCFLVNFVAEI